MRKGGGRESFANYALINSLQWWSVREVFKKIWKFLMAFAMKGGGGGKQNEQVQITIITSQLFFSKTSIYWIHLVQWSLGFRGISLFALQERERGSTKRFSKFAERDAKRNARDLYENGSQILNNCGLQKNYKSMR